MDYRLEQIINGTAGHHAALDAVVRDTPDANVEPLLADAPSRGTREGPATWPSPAGELSRASHVRT